MTTTTEVTLAEGDVWTYTTPDGFRTSYEIREVRGESVNAKRVLRSPRGRQVEQFTAVHRTVKLATMLAHKGATK